MKNTGTEYMSTERTPTVRPDFAELLPPLSDEQLSLLEADILKNGCYTPVIVNEELVIVDGHNRASICDKHGVPYRMAVFSFEDDLEAKQWALDTQKSRRNLSINELCKIALKLRPEVEARAKEKMAMVMAENRQFNPNNTNEQISTPVSKSVPETLDTRKELAKTVGVGEVTMGRAMKIEDEAPQPVRDAVDSGELTIAQGYTLTKELQELDLPDEEKEQAALEAVEREIARKNESRKRKINENTRIAKGFSSAFEASLLLDPTKENISIWVEQGGITYDSLDNIIAEAKRLSERYAIIADILENHIKAKHWRNNENEQEEYTEDSPEGEDPDTAGTAG